jgi:hypothetical protein
MIKLKTPKSALMAAPNRPQQARKPVKKVRVMKNSAIR